VFVTLFFGTFAIFAIVLSASGLDLVTALSASATALANVGPGLGIIGPAGNFESLADGQKLLLCLAMIMGRLEILGVLLLLLPGFYR
jgi:trk system potassium uptake protein TrkH